MLIKALALGVLIVTSYRPVPGQTKPECTDRHHCDTANGNNVSMYGAAASRDLFASGEVHFGDVLWIDGFGYRIIDDVMGAKARRQIDLLVFTTAQEKAIGVKRRAVYVLTKGKL